MARDDAIMAWDGEHAHKIRVDHETGSLVTIAHASMEGHEGHAYSCTWSVASIGALDNDVMQLTWTTPNTENYMHMVIHAKCSALALFRFNEGWTGGGTAAGTQLVNNRNRNSNNVSSVTVSYGYTIVTGGVNLKTEYLAAGKFGSGEYRSINEWILRRNTNYAVNLFLDAAEEAVISLHWYEHTKD